MSSENITEINNLKTAVRSFNKLQRQHILKSNLLNKAENAGLQFEGSFCQITLNVHSSLEAVGLTAAVSAKLSAQGISANVIAAYYHDHIFVQSAKAEMALLALQEFSA